MTTAKLSLFSWIARLALVAGAVCLYLSPDRPYWEMKLHAAQYQNGLNVIAYPDRIAGDVREIDGLNHYIGMKELEKAAKFERAIGRPAVYVMAAILVLAAIWSTRWSPLLVAPAVLFPALFLGDLYWWLRDYGLNLDRTAAMSNSIKPFVPTVLGEGKVGQFRTEAWIGDGMALALIASAAGLLFTYARWFEWYVVPSEAASSTPPAPSPTASAKKPLAPVALVAVLFAFNGSGRIATAAEWDVRPSSPLTTIAAAVNAAADGDTIHVYGGQHAGPLTVNKSVRLIGHDWPVIDGAGRDSVVTLAAAKTHFEGFVVRGSGDRLANEDGDGGIVVAATDCEVVGNRLEDVLFGISLRESHRTQVRNNRLRGKDLDIARRGDLIRLWWSHDVTIAGNDIADGRDLVLWYSKRLTVRDNTARHGRYGIHFMYCDEAVVTGNTFSDNSVGSFLMYSRGVRLEENWIENNRGASGYGVGLKDMTDYTLHRNVIVSNRAGVFMEGAKGQMSDNLVAYNERGVVIFTSCTHNAIRDNTFTENGEQVAAEGNTPLATTNVWAGNFWSDYRGLDSDGDGYGDRPYQQVQLFERLTDRNSGMKLFAHGPAAEAIDYSAKLFPVFQPKSKFADARPRMAALPPPLTRPAGVNWSFLPLGMALMVTATGGLMMRGPTPAPTGTAVTPPPPAPAPLPTAVQVSHLSKSFGSVKVLDDLSFEILPGEAVALWGANGAGKTTLIRCLLGLFPFDGQCSVNGHRCGLRGKESRRALGYVPQEVKLPTDHTVIECVKFYAALRRVPAQRGIHLLAEWGLEAVHDRAIRHLSGGMRQKLALVLALLSDPPVLILDEPTSNLDVATREDFGRLLARLKAAGKTLLFCTHRTGEIMTLADKVVVLEAGRKVAEGTPEQLRSRLLKPAVLRLTVATEHREVAVSTLRDGGFTVRADGGEVWLDVPAGQKADALRRLQQAGVTVFDFDIESDRGFQGVDQ